SALHFGPQARLDGGGLRGAQDLGSVLFRRLDDLLCALDSVHLLARDAPALRGPAARNRRHPLQGPFELFTRHHPSASHAHRNLPAPRLPPTRPSSTASAPARYCLSP